MKIMVCVKQVIDISMPFEVDPATNTVKWEVAELHLLNPADGWAVQRAVQLKDELKDGTVTAVSLGQERVVKALRECLSLGADAAIRIDNSSLGVPLDAFGTALVLSRYIDRLRPDLVFCGAASADIGSRSVGPMLAEVLGLPHVSDVVDFRVESGHGLVAERQLSRGDRESVWCPLPALLTLVATGCSRYVSLPMLMRAMRATVQTLDLKELGLGGPQDSHGLNATRLEKVSPPRPRPRKIYMPDSNLPPEERLRLLLAGGPRRRQPTNTLEGTPEELADGAINFMRQLRIL